jgi:hypothetical protein
MCTHRALSRALLSAYRGGPVFDEVLGNDDLRAKIAESVGPHHWSKLNKLHHSEAPKLQRVRDVAAYLSGIVDPGEKEFVRQSLESVSGPVYPLPPRDPSNRCPLLERVLAQAYRADPPNNKGGSYLDPFLRLKRQRPDEPLLTAPDELMRILKGVMLNGLCRGIREFEIELNKDAVPHFVQGMKVGMPDLRILQIVFHPDISETDLVTVLDSLISSHAALPYLILSGAVPALHKRMRFPTQIGILSVQAKSFGEGSVPLLTESGQFTQLHSLYLRGTSVTTAGIRKITMAQIENKFHPKFRIVTSPSDGYREGNPDYEMFQKLLVRRNGTFYTRS